MNFEISIKKTQYLKGLAIILIIFSHLKVIRFGGGIGVALFLFLSGYGIYESYSKHGLKNYWSKKIKKVLIPYWIFNSIWIILDFILNIRHPLKTILYSFLTYKNTIDVTMWYISYIIVWYIVFWIIFKFIKNKYLKLIILILSTIIIHKISIHGFFGIGGGANLYTIFYPLGISINYLLKNHKEKIEKYIISVLTVLIFGFLYLYSNQYNIIFSNNQVTVIIFCASMLLIMLIGLFKITINDNIVLLFGKYSYYIYLLEGVLINKYPLIFKIINNRILEIIIFLVFNVLLAKSFSIIYTKFQKLIDKINIFAIITNKFLGK